MPCDTTVEGSPGNKIKVAPDFIIPALAVVPLAPPAAGTRRQTVQNTSLVAGHTVRVREFGGVLGAGFILDALQSVSFGGADGAVGPLEVEGNAVFGTTVAQGFEGSAP